MLKQRILATLRFFRLQGIPLTLFELHKYLLNDPEMIRWHMGANWEVNSLPSDKDIASAVALADVQACLTEDCRDEVVGFRGYYYLSGQDQEFVLKRLYNYSAGIKRERLIRRYAKGLPYLPFIRGVGLVGSQAMGLYKPDSDIDLLILVEPHFLWLARLFVTAYFQIFGVRRHGQHIANRFCLNHYLSGPKPLSQDRNIYTAYEYVKLRPLYPSLAMQEFKRQNIAWTKLFFPNTPEPVMTKITRPKLQVLLEKVFSGSFGRKLEQWVGLKQLNRINRDEFVVVEEDELSFHPNNRKQQLFQAFFEHQQ